MLFTLEGIRHFAQGREGSGAVVEARPIGIPCGEGFHLHGGFRDVRNPVLFHIVEDEVRAVVDDLDFVAVHDVERLSGKVRGEDNPWF